MEIDMKYTIEKAVELLYKEYEDAKNQPYVKDPLAYALHQVWKKVDAHRKF